MDKTLPALDIRESAVGPLDLTRSPSLWQMVKLIICISLKSSDDSGSAE